MLRHVPEPLHAGGFEADVGVEAAGDGAVDDRLLLLLQQLDQLLLGADVAPDPPVRVVEKPHDGGLFGEGWEGKPGRLDGAVRKAVSCDSVRLDVELIRDAGTLHRAKEIRTIDTVPERAQQCQVIAADQVVGGVLYKRGDTDVVPRLGSPW